MEGTVLDIVLIAAGLLCVVLGFFQGAVRALIGLAALILGAVFAPALGGFLCGLFVSREDLLGFAVGQIVCTLIAFFVIVAVVRLLGKLLDLIFQLPGLHFLNRLLGGVVGAAKGFLLVLVLCALLQALLPALAQRYPESVDLHSFSSSRLVKLPARAGEEVESANPLFTFYEQHLREGINLHAQGEE